MGCKGIRSGLILTGGFLALTTGLVAGPAYASNECGVQGTGAVVCASTGSPYATGITYAATQDLTLDLDSGVVVNTTSTGDKALVVGGTKITSDVTINAEGSSVITTAASATGYTVASGSGDIDLDIGSISTTGASARGISAASTSGNVTVSAQSITTTGASASAILAQSTTGTATVTNNGTISTAGSAAYGIYARGVAGVTVDGTGTVATTGDNSNAIDAISSAGPVTVTQGTVTTSGANSIGIRAGAEDDASVTVANVTTTGAAANAISAFSLSGATSVTVTGAVKSSQAVGVAITAVTTATLNVGQGATLDGYSGAVQITSGTGTLIDNAGTIGPEGASALTAITIDATGGAVTINNSGTINGNVLTSDADDVLTNTGTFNAISNSDFHAGNDLLDNQGTFNVAPTSTTATTIKIYALETFENSGTLDFRNGHAGDELIVQGDYVGEGDKLYLDVDPSNLAGSDSMVFGGSASGTTVVTLNKLTNAPLELDSGTPIVTVGTASEAGAFTLDPSQSDTSGLVGLGIKYDAANLTYDLVAFPGDAAYRTLAISAGVRNLWAQSADAWSARMQQLRDVFPAGADHGTAHVWGQVIGQRQTRDFSKSTTVFGITRQVDVDYAQNTFGGQIGADFRTSAKGQMVYGITGGYLHSTLSYRHVADRVKFDDVNGGAYFGYSAHGLFLNVLGKYDYYWADNNSVSGGYSNKLSGASYGARAEFGARFKAHALFFEPIVSVSANHSQIEDFTLSAGRFNFDDPDSLVLKAGGRIGSALSLFGQAGSSVYLRANYVNDLSGKDRVVFSSGNDGAALEMGAASPYGEAAIGATIAGKSGLRLSVEGNYARGGDSDGFGGRVTLGSAF